MDYVGKEEGDGLTLVRELYLRLYWGSRSLSHAFELFSGHFDSPQLLSRVITNEIFKGRRRHFKESLAFLSEGQQLKMNAPEFEFLPQLDSLAQHGCILVLLMQVLDDLCFVHSVCPPQVARTLLPGFEGQHVIEFVVGWSPERAPERKPEFLASAFPVVVEDGCQFFEVGQCDQLRIVFLQERDNPALASRQHAVSAGLTLQLNHHSAQEVLIQHIPNNCKTLPESTQEEPVHLGQLIGLGPWEAERSRQANVVERNASCWLARSEARHHLDPWHHDLLFGVLFYLLGQREEAFGGDECVVIGC